MKPNLIVVLLVGLVLGFAIGKVLTSSRSDAPTVVTERSPSPAAGEGEASLPIKSSDMPAEIFAGMTDAQKYAAMRVMNDNTCDCGCPHDSLAGCAKQDPHCPVAPAKIKHAAALAKAGKSAAEIQAEMFGGPPKGAAARAQAQDSEVSKVPIDGSPSHGKPTALVTMVEISDYQCPFCANANQTVEELQKQYGDKLRLVMKQNPLPMHPDANSASLAALAAGEQGKYWQMHQRLFANQKALDAQSLEKHAREIGLDLASWKKALANPKLQEKIRNDQALAASLGATGTPAFFINGRRLSGAQPIATFKRVIDEELTKAEAMVKEGVRSDQVYAKIMEKASAAQAEAAANPAPEVQKIALGSAPVKGPKNAPVTIVVFSDFQCPYCSRAVPTLKAIEQQYGSKVKLAFKHQPLPIHQNARLAAAASMAANEQGKFWLYHDKLFENQQALDRASLEKYAAQLDLNMPKFKAALDSNKFDAQISADSSEGAQLGANATPTFFINGRQLIGAQPVDAFKVIIDEELKKPEKGPGTKHAAAAR